MTAALPPRLSHEALHAQTTPRDVEREGSDASTLGSNEHAGEDVVENVELRQRLSELKAEVAELVGREATFGAVEKERGKLEREVEYLAQRNHSYAEQLNDLQLRSVISDAKSQGLEKARERNALKTGKMVSRLHQKLTKVRTQNKTMRTHFTVAKSRLQQLDAERQELLEAVFKNRSNLD